MNEIVAGCCVTTNDDVSADGSYYVAYGVSVTYYKLTANNISANYEVLATDSVKTVLLNINNVTIIIEIIKSA